MKIELITKEKYNRILEIQKKFSILTFQNKGYEGVNRNIFSEEEKKADIEMNEILKNHIHGFKYFQNFKHDKNKNLVLRFQYNYDYETGNSGFVGVGYILLDELLKGFN